MEFLGRLTVPQNEQQNLLSLPPIYASCCEHADNLEYSLQLGTGGEIPLPNNPHHYN